jgi:hypothetical protein
MKLKNILEVKLNDLDIDFGNHYMAVFSRDHNTCFWGRTVASSEKKAINNFMFHLRLALKEYRNPYNKIPKDTSENVKVFRDRDERNAYRDKFSNKKWIGNPKYPEG